MSEEQVIINKTENPNSYEVGKTGNRLKIYFSSAAHLKEQIESLKSIGVYPEE